MKNNGLVKVVAGVLVFFFVAFAGYHAFRHYFSDYTTVSPLRQTVSRSVLTEGIMIREEKALAVPAAGTVRYTAEEGKKVKVGSVIGYSHASPLEASTAAEAEKKRHELEMLKRLEDQYQQIPFKKAEQISGEIDIGLVDLSREILSGNFSALEAEKLALQEGLNTRALLMKEGNALTERVEELSGASEAGGGTPIRSDGVGYFSHFVDHMENTLTPDLIGNLSSEEFRTLMEKEVVFEENAFGKVITDDTWYFVAEIPAEQAEGFFEGGAVTLSFSGSGNSAVPARVHLLEPSPNGKTVLMTVIGDVITPDVVSHRIASVKISSKSYTGLRFDASLLHVIDRQKGVYVDGGYFVKFKKVDIIYTGNDYYLSRLNYSSEDSLNLFDKLIISDKELYDGMPLEDL